jgi:hypothetical protein
MVTIRTQSQIVSDMLDGLRVSQPSLDTKPGTVSRDLLVDNFANQQARLYGELSRVATSQSIRQSIGTDLERWGDGNFSVPKDKGKKATGPAVLTFSSLSIDFAINTGDQVFSKSGATFTVVNGTTISSVNANQYKAFASRIRADLDFAGISDLYAVQVLVQCTSLGSAGNISKFSLNGSNIAGVNRVTNIVSFGGGLQAESDASYRNRIFSVFSGSNTGTQAGYLSVAKQDPSVIDAIVITPGDSLMTRDGTQVSIAEDGTRTVVSDGTGGKVDIITLGVRLQANTDSFIYQDKSNTGDATNSANDFTLGQVSGDENKTVTRKRLDNLSSGILPNQPINDIIDVSGTLSGNNFKERVVDADGIETGNYQLIRDTGVYSGSPWGFDRLHWISNTIKSFSEEKTKLLFNGQDSLGFTDAAQISSAVQIIPIVNENSLVVTSDRSLIQLAHQPTTTASRVQNITTGERYVIASQNPDSTGSLNATGRIRISGKNLPSTTDILQVDYNWSYTYDRFYDFDDLLTSDNARTAGDSVDWGYSNLVRRELSILVSSGSFLTATTQHPVASVIKVMTTIAENATILLVNNRLAVTVTATVSNVVGVLDNGIEIFNTSAGDAGISGSTIFLPSDTSGKFGDIVTVSYNGIDVYDTTGNFSGSTVSVMPASSATVGTIVEVTYVADVSTLLPSTVLSLLPAVRNGNRFNTLSASSVGVQPTTHTFDISGSIVSNLRKAPTNLALTINGSISPGIITVGGISVFRVLEAIVTVGTSGLLQDMSSAIKTSLGISSNSSIPSNIKISRIARVEKVTTTTSLKVKSVDATYDLTGYTIQDSSYVRQSAGSSSLLSPYQFTLPSTTANISNSPVVGDRIRVSFYYIKTGDTEDVSFSKAGTLYTNKKFATIDTISVSSGFTSTSSASATLLVTNLNQPTTRSRYSALYDYTSPKINERIVINYNSDRLIMDVTLAIEDKRPITADVLVKSAVPVAIDAILTIIVKSDFVNSSNIVLQNVKDAIVSSLNSNALNTTVDSSDLTQIAYTVNGVDAVKIIQFNRANSAGSVLSITAQKNEYLLANSIQVQLGTR